MTTSPPRYGRGIVMPKASEGVGLGRLPDIEELTPFEKIIIRIPVLQYLYLIPLLIYNLGLGLLEEKRFRDRYKMW